MIIYPTEYRATSNFGGGLFATSDIAPGAIVACFDVDYWNWDESVSDLPNDSPDYTRDHTIQYAPGKSRDSDTGLGRYANHSCDPNCGIKNYFDLVAMRPIAKGEQITWDYAMTENNDWFMICRCGSPRCRKMITGYRNLPPEFREAYKGFISQWLIDAEVPYEGPAKLPAWLELTAPTEFVKETKSPAQDMRTPRAS